MIELGNKWDYFISHTKTPEDVAWAQWIAWCLNSAGFTTFVRGGDVRAGEDVVATRMLAISKATTIVLLLSPEYLADPEVVMDRDTALVRRQKPGEEAALLPIHVKECRNIQTYEYLTKLIQPITLFNLNEADAKEILLREMPRRGRLISHPRYPQRPKYPGPSQRPPPPQQSSTPHPDTQSKNQHFPKPFTSDSGEIEIQPQGASPAATLPPEQLKRPAAPSAVTLPPEQLKRPAAPPAAALPPEQLKRPAAPPAATLPPEQLNLPSGASPQGKTPSTQGVPPLLPSEHNIGLDRRNMSMARFSRSSDGRYIAIGLGDSDGTIHILDMLEGKTEFLRHQTTFQSEGKVTALAWSHDGQRLASARWDQSMLQSGIEIWDLPARKVVLCGDSKKQHRYKIRALAWSPDSQYLASSAAPDPETTNVRPQEDIAVWVWKPAVGTREYTYVTREQKPVYSLAWSPNGTFVAAGTSNYIDLWEHPGGAPAHSFQCSSGMGLIETLSWSHNGRHLAAAEKTLEVWDTMTHSPVFMYKNEEKGKQTYYINTLLWSPNNVSLLWAGNDAMIHLWNSKNQEQRPMKVAFQDSDLSIHEIALFPDASGTYIIAIACSDGVIRLQKAPEGLL